MTSLVELFFDDSSSDDDDDFDFVTAMLVDIKSNRSKHGGSVMGRAVVRRKKQAGHIKLMEDYFVDAPVFGPRTFRRRFRMSRDLFMHIAKAVEAHCPYFVQKRNASGELCHSALKKIAASVRMLAYGCPADVIDDWIHIAESTVIKSLKKFVKSVIEIFGEHYLREPNVEDTARLMQMSESKGFRGMLGCIDCMHWRWKNCPAAWHGQFTGHCHDPTIILEAVASNDLWIWHAYFGMPGSHNDLNVLQRSPLFARLARGEAPSVTFEINGHQYTKGYYLADGIYPSWATFLKSI
ncbi:putative nuclease HARBI1 [Panicum miliaceum]|uniref:Nuclease HARBI1 n=1 Tax=Panicum miliaceum TaxID=4540 RepID=A0A3L6SN72_PANMI|nr:putative nuclease HARBI1 [Panicum miliaceum]